MAVASAALLTLDVVLPPLSGQSSDLDELQLSGSEYLNPSGLGTSAISAFNPAGYVGGYSRRFSGTGASLGQDAWLASTDTGLSLQAGLTTSQFQTAAAVAGYAAGYRSSSVGFLSANGFAAGTSATFNHTDLATTGPGQAVWVANAATGQTTRVGLSGSGFETTTGFVMSLLNGITVQGEAWGTSKIYDGSGNNDGQAAWVATSEGVTRRVGLWGDGYLQAGSFAESSSITRVTAGGYAGGTSARYGGTVPTGQDAWVQNIRSPGSSAVAIGLGLTDTSVTEFSRAVAGTSTLYRFNGLSVMNESSGNYIGGYTSRFSGSQQRGQAAWIHTIGGSAIRVGFFSNDASNSIYRYTFHTGFQLSEVLGISSNGTGIGYSQRYSPAGTALGRATFIVNVPTNTTVQAGLTTGIFNSSINAQENTPLLVSNSGWVVGTAVRYNDSTANGKAAWVASAATGVTFQIGLADATAANSENSVPSKLTESGYIAGSTEGPISGSISGKAAWIARASDHTTTRVGLFGAANTLYQSQSGFQLSTIQFLTESGYAAGYSARFIQNDNSAYNALSATSGSAGVTSWIYHIPTGTFSPISLSIRVSDSYSNTQILALYETGLALGTYELFNSSGALVGDRAFAWLPTVGYYDLGTNVGATLGIEGWASLNSAEYADIYGRIVGFGTRLTNSNLGDSVFVLETIPEPNAALLGLIGAGWCALARRRRAA